MRKIIEPEIESKELNICEELKFLSQILAEEKQFTNITIVCIGTDRCSGDSLGPFVGHLLKQMGIEKYSNVTLLGTLENPIHALNVESEISQIDKDSLVIAVDASVSEAYSLNSISIKDEPVRPGQGLGKNLPSVGDISIHGIVTEASEGIVHRLNNVRIYHVYSMAETIAKGIYRYLQEHVEVKSLFDINQEAM